MIIYFTTGTFAINKLEDKEIIDALINKVGGIAYNEWTNRIVFNWLKNTNIL